MTDAFIAIIYSIVQKKMKYEKRFSVDVGVKNALLYIFYIFLLTAFLFVL